MDIREITAEVEREGSTLAQVRSELRKQIIGQDRLLDRLLIGLISNAHLLIEGVPGLAKTLAVTTLAQAIRSSFRRIQFTPDLLPADLVGTLVYHPGSGEFTTKKGPIFANIVLADEINRAPAKVQSALLEAMQERQVTIGDATHPLDDPFMVLATQNPIEQEGTYPLPEAQVDRFMLKVVVGYPGRDEELAIVRRVARTEPPQPVSGILDPADFARPARARGLHLPRREGGGVHRRPGALDAGTGRLWPGDRQPDRVRRLAARHHLPDARRRAPGPSCRDAASSRRRTSRPWRPTCSATG